jgi:ankyrin repeat protein
VGANKDAKAAGGATPLNWAARNEHVEAVVVRGANIGARNDEGLTPSKSAPTRSASCMARVLRELERRTAARTQQAAAQSQSAAATATTTQA